ncbi:MAG TPA: glucose-6-phosphate isomerase [Chloroflexota bacterium]|nr:glucose-6-phosphate isomerase [Chloroflexota bacterium]
MSRFEQSTWRDNMRITFDYNNLMADAIGPDRGLTANEIQAHEDRCRRAHQALRSKRGTGDMVWTELPYQTGVVADIKAYADSVAGQFDDLIVLGIGGSSLGTIALQTALCHPHHNLLPLEQRGGRPRLFVLDNVDPDWIDATLRLVDLDRTLVNVITKSGTTAETMSQFLVVRDRLVQRFGADHANHIVATTDPSKGELRAIADAEGYRTFDIPEGVGGRFSVLSPVGLLPAALVGIDTGELLAGAAFGDDLCAEADVWRNPAYMNALLQYILYNRGVPMSVMMPYSQALRDVADWYRQLWAESLGKARSTSGQVVNVGPTPIKSLGVTDQHSQVQLYVEGPNDKVVDLVGIGRFATDIEIPSAFEQRPNVAYLAGHTIGGLMQAEREGTAIALTEAGRPNCIHMLPEVNAFTVGQFMYMLEMQTAFSGELFDINAFDQPGVEAGKVAAYALMGRTGFEAERDAINARRQHNPRYVI